MKVVKKAWRERYGLGVYYGTIEEVIEELKGANPDYFPVLFDLFESPYHDIVLYKGNEVVRHSTPALERQERIMNLPNNRKYYIQISRQDGGVILFKENTDGTHVFTGKEVKESKLEPWYKIWPIRSLKFKKIALEHEQNKTKAI